MPAPSLNPGIFREGRATARPCNTLLTRPPGACAFHSTGCATSHRKSCPRSVRPPLTGKKIETKYALDPALLGGAVVPNGDTIYDGSVRSRLNGMPPGPAPG